MLRVGLTGGFATGKSNVAAELGQLGCSVISADKLGHEVMLPSGEAYSPVVQLFGEGILSADRSIDRRKLGEMVFKSPERLKQLADLVHPAVYRREAELIAGYAAANPKAIIVTEAAILIETGRYKTFDRLIVTICSPETQILRAMKRDGLTHEQVVERLSHQLPAIEKTRYAHYVVDTDGPKENTAKRVREIYLDLVRLAEANT